MNTLNRLLVGLDLTAVDDTLIAYTAYLSAELQVGQVTFIHVEKDLEVPSELLPNLQREGGSIGDSMQDMITTKVRTMFSQLPQVETEVLVVEGNPFKQLLHWAKEKQVDLILVGRKLRLSGSGVLGQKLLRSGRNSMLFVPEAFKPRLRQIVLSSDFSKYSEMALGRVLQAVAHKSDVQMSCVHVYEVPSGYITLGMSYVEFDERMQGFAREKYARMLSHFPELQDRCDLILVRKREQEDVGALVTMEAKRIHADLLVIGAKGMSGAAVFMLGSVTEKVLQHDMDIPLLVFKNKDEKVSFLDALIG